MGPTMAVLFLTIQGGNVIALINNRRAVAEAGVQPIPGEIWMVRHNGYTDQGVIKLHLEYRVVLSE